MKRIAAMLLALTMLTGCAAAPLAEVSRPDTVEERAQPIQHEEITPEPSYQEIRVSGVDELLAALGSDRVIILEPGTYDLTQAAAYGESPEKGVYTWDKVFDGYQLRLVGVRNMCLRGGGQENTVLQTQPRYANVLALQNCTDVLLEDFTAGHTEDQGECSGGVLLLEGCSLVKLNRLGLFGCGVTGVSASISTHISITDCHIYDCSSSAVVFSKCHTVEIMDSRLDRIGTGDYGGWAVMDLRSCSDVTVERCRISESEIYSFLSASHVGSILLKENVFADNRLKQAAFDVQNTTLTLDGCSFENNNIRLWLSEVPGFGAVILDGQGESLTEEKLQQLYPAPEAPAEPAERKVVEAATVDEFLAAIAPDTEIILTGELYDLAAATGYGETATEYYHWTEEFDGPALVINNTHNLLIRSDDGDVSHHTVSAEPRYADVLTFLGCANVTVSGFTAGHTKEPGVCAGGVIAIRDSDSVRIENCGLFGCGILGVEAEYSGDVTVSGCDIYECSLGGIRMRVVNGVVVENCTFRDLGGDALSFIGCREVTVDGEDWPG